MLRCTDPAGENAWANRPARVLDEIETVLREQRSLL